jgi:hypothetical protein
MIALPMAKLEGFMLKNAWRQSAKIVSVVVPIEVLIAYCLADDLLLKKVQVMYYTQSTTNLFQVQQFSCESSLAMSGDRVFITTLEAYNLKRICP